jgi:glycosyltransferase involved in cell wall biosynthesis
VSVQQSLSVVLPVYNAEQTLTEKVHRLLDLLPDLTHRFEVLIVDDGSVDQTGEVAYELSREYPQVQMVQHGSRLGWSGVIATALQRTWGEVLFVQDEGREIDSTEFTKLWALRERSNLYPPLSSIDATGKKPSLMKRLAAWGVRLEQANQRSQASGLQMIRRGAPPSLARAEVASKASQASKISRMDGPQRSSISAKEAAIKKRLST